MFTDKDRTGNRSKMKTSLFPFVVFCTIVVSWIGTRAAAESRTFVDIVGQLKDATFRVETSEGRFLGTAFAVNRYGDFVTCCHVVSPGGATLDTIYLCNYTNMKVISENDTAESLSHLKFAARVTARIPRLDFAVLHVNPDHYGIIQLTFLPLASLDMVHEGDDVTLCAFIPDTFTLPRAFIANGIVSTIRRAVYNGTLANEVDLLQLDLAAAKGTSGGPVYSRSTGRVVAMQNSGIFETANSSQTSYPIAMAIGQFLEVLDSLQVPLDVKLK